MPNIFDGIAALTSKTKTKPAYFGSIVSFSSTTGTWFSISIEDLIQSLNDILANLSQFETAGREYSEAPWRSVIREHFSSEVSRDLALSQTMPFFLLLSKIISASNPGSDYKERYIDLDAKSLEGAILALQTAIDDSTGKENSSNTGPVVTGGENRLFYGAPGTGKSHRVEQTKRGKAFRTVFHPDTQNSDFIGSLKPALSDQGITYAFSPGPFANALAYAWSHPDREATLIIEELNRAPAAAVFGELFLLLDRHENGEGCYDADFPSEEFAQWFKTHGTVSEKMRIPANLWIYATMNSADQGVYPLDTAFRRRWAATYIPINYDITPESVLSISSEVGAFKVTWRDFVSTLNEFLVDLLQIEEDRLVGPRFVNNGDLADRKLPGKLLIYLWDDLLRHGSRSLLFSETLRSYGELHNGQDSNIPIFSPAFIELLRSVQTQGGNAPATDTLSN